MLNAPESISSADGVGEVPEVVRETGIDSVMLLWTSSATLEISAAMLEEDSAFPAAPANAVLSSVEVSEGIAELPTPALEHSDL